MYHIKEQNNKYLRKIKNIPMLSKEEEYQLAKEWREKNTDAAMQKLVKSHLFLVSKIAEGYRGYGMPLNELITEGSMGVIHATKHYDPDKGFRFSTYASWWIKSFINEYILGSWSLVKIGNTVNQKKLFFSLKKTHKEIMKNHQLDDNGNLNDEIAEKIALKLQVSKKEVFEMYVRVSGKDSSLNCTVNNDDGDDKTEFIEWCQDNSPSPEEISIYNDEMNKRRQALKQIMETFSPREKTIFIARNLTEPPATLELLSKQIGISKERVRQIDHGIFDKIKKQIKNKFAKLV